MAYFAAKLFEGPFKRGGFEAAEAVREGLRAAAKMRHLGNGVPQLPSLQAKALSFRIGL